MYWLTQLREFKNEKGITYKEISEHTGVALTTVEKLFSGRTADPKLSMVTKITQLLGHDVTELIPGSTDTLSQHEKVLLSRFRSLDENGKRRVSDTITSELCRIAAEKSAVMQRYSRIYYDFPVSAGTGELLDNRTAVIAELDTEPPYGTDYILRISGNSMEPDFKNGDFVYVHSCENIQYGEIGIFVAEGSVYMKEYTPQGLKSLNPDYDIIKFFDGVRCLGKVIGILEGKIFV